MKKILIIVAAVLLTVLASIIAFDSGKKTSMNMEGMRKTLDVAAKR